MSGLESLAVFSIACNVMQVISFAQDTTLRLKGIYRDGCADPDQLKATSQMRDAVGSLKDALKSGQPHTKEQAKLFEVANSCSEVAEKLTSKLEEYTNTSTASTGVAKKMGKTVILGLKRSWNEHRIEELEKDLKRFQDSMETILLIQMW
jgi:hypothetical protein